MADTIVGFRVDEEIARRLQAQAEREERSVSGLLRRLVARYLKEQGAKNAKNATELQEA